MVRQAVWALAVLWGVSASAAEDPLQLYRQMRHAVHNTDYEGRFVYQVGNRLDALYVVHRMQDGHELERLVALNGDSRQVIRGAKAVACLDSHRRRISVVGSDARIANSRPLDTGKLASLYEFSIGGAVREAGRPALELLITPRDDLRYGYRIALDRESSLPLRSVMLDRDGRVLSQTLFVDIKSGRHITPIERDLSALQLTETGEEEAGTVTVGAGDPGGRQWRIGELPRGFELVETRAASGGMRHYLFSDGLTSVSLYLEQSPAQPFEGFSRISTVDVYGTQRDGVQLTVVGEVPPETLQLIADALQYDD